MSTKISVIMPVYNASEFLDEALQSIIKQSFKEFELIAVDDGSKDNSLEILRKYEKKYSFIQVITQKNAGPSAARNAGLKVASGKYVYFPDADDTLTKKCLESMYQRAEETNADMVIAKYDTFNRISKTKVNNIDRLTGEETINPLDQDILLTFSLCNKLFLRETIVENEMSFPPVSYSEDGVFVMRFAYAAKKITGLSQVVYHYRKINDGIHASITSTVSEQKVKDYLKAHEMIYESMFGCFQKLSDQKLDCVEAYMKQNKEIHDYVNIFIKKEITVLFNQFYKKFWTFEKESTITFIVEEINRLLAKLDLKNYMQLCETHYELNLNHLYRNYQEAVNDARVTVLLYADQKDANKFNEIMVNLNGQNLIPFKIIVPAHMRCFIEKEGLFKDNISYLDCDNRDAFWMNGYNKCDTDYILFEDAFFNIAPMGIKEMYIVCDKNKYDFMSFGVYFADSFRQYPIKVHNQTLRQLQDFRKLQSKGNYELFLQNKIFAVDFLKRISFELKKQSTREISKKMYDVGFYFTSLKRYFAFQGNASQFMYDVVNNMDAYHTKEKLSLSDPEFNTEEKVVNAIIPIDWKNNKKDETKNKYLELIKRLPVRNTVLLISDEKKGSNNLVAIKKAIGKKCKVITAFQKTPHSKGYKLWLFYQIATSKVIVADQNQGYFCSFPMKRNQRIIRLEDYPGANKKLGIHLSKLLYDSECALHVQYNMVNVSSDYVRSIYADAFQTDFERVCALGTPKTDLYFDEKEIAKCKDWLKKYYSVEDDKKAIVYFPDYQHNQQKEIRSTVQTIVECLAEDEYLIVAGKMNEGDTKFDNVLSGEDVDEQWLLVFADAVISERPDLISECTLLNKPSLGFWTDGEEEKQQYFADCIEALPCPIARNQDELSQMLQHFKKDYNELAVKEYVDKYMGACDGNSAKRIADVIVRYLEYKKGNNG